MSGFYGNSLTIEGIHGCWKASYLAAHYPLCRLDPIEPRKAPGELGLLSASADQPLKAVNKAFDDKALLEARRLNQEDPTYYVK